MCEIAIGLRHDPRARHALRPRAAFQDAQPLAVRHVRRRRVAVDLRDARVLPVPERARAVAPRRRTRIRRDGHLVDDDGAGRGRAADAAADGRSSSCWSHLRRRSGRSSCRSRWPSRRSASTRSRSGSCTSACSTASRSRSTTGWRSPSRSPPRSARSDVSASSSPSVLVRYRSAFMLGNVFEWPVWMISGLLIPVAVLPGLAAAGLVALRADVGHACAAPRDARHAAPPWVDIAVCAAALASPTSSPGRVSLRFFLRSARARATLALT